MATKRKNIMAEINVVGKIKMLGQTMDVGTSGFQKRELVVTTEEQYPQHILINFVQDKCNLLANYKVGDNVNVGINLRGREWINPQGEVKYFNDIQGWKIATVVPAYVAAMKNSANEAKQNQAAEFKPTSNFTEEEEDDLPF